MSEDLPSANRPAPSRLALLVLLFPILLIVWIWETGPSSNEPAETQNRTAVHVSIGTIQRGTVRRFVTVFGTVVPSPATATTSAASARLSTPQAAIIEKVLCVEGQHVAEGQALFTVRDPVIQSQITDCQHRLQVIDTLNARTPEHESAWYHGLLSLVGDFTQSQIEQLTDRQSALTVCSPLGGTVTNVAIQPGTVTDPHVPCVEVVDLNRLIIEAGVPASEVGLFSAAQPVQIKRPESVVSTTSIMGFPTTRSSSLKAGITGRVLLVDQRVDPANGTATVDIALPADCGLLPGAFVSAKVNVSSHDDVLTVPAEAVVQNDDGRFVVSLVSGNVATPVHVDVGLRDHDRVEIRGPKVKPGLTVVTTGAYAITDDCRVICSPSSSDKSDDKSSDESD